MKVSPSRWPGLVVAAPLRRRVGLPNRWYKVPSGFFDNPSSPPLPFPWDRDLNLSWFVSRSPLAWWPLSLRGEGLSLEERTRGSPRIFGNAPSSRWLDSSHPLHPSMEPPVINCHGRHPTFWLSHGPGPHCIQIQIPNSRMLRGPVGFWPCDDLARFVEDCIHGPHFLLWSIPWWQALVHRWMRLLWLPGLPTYPVSWSRFWDVQAFHGARHRSGHGPHRAAAVLLPPPLPAQADAPVSATPEASENRLSLPSKAQWSCAHEGCHPLTSANFMVHSHSYGAYG